jgi:hypothetical protein
LLKVGSTNCCIRPSHAVLLLSSACVYCLGVGQCCRAGESRNLRSDLGPCSEHNHKNYGVQIGAVRQIFWSSSDAQTGSTLLIALAWSNSVLLTEVCCEMKFVASGLWVCHSCLLYAV